MTSSPSDTASTEEETAEEEAVAEPHPLADYAQRVAESVGGEAVITFDTIKVNVPNEAWVDTLTTARDEWGLISFSFLSAIDWSNDVAVGDPLSEELETERLELLAAVSDLSEGKLVIFTTYLDHQQPTVPTLTGVYSGADWHEREAHEMFGIDFPGHPNLAPLYLPEHFVGNPLRKSFPLLSREVKPWPGKVDVEAMPEAEEEEAAEETTAAAGDGEGDDETAPPQDTGADEDEA